MLVSVVAVLLVVTAEWESASLQSPPQYAQSAPDSQTHAGSSSARSAPDRAEPKAEKRGGVRYQFQKVKEWRAAVREHVRGEADEPARLIAGWPDEDIGIVIDFLTKLTSQSPKSIKRALSKERYRNALELTDEEARQGDLRLVLKRGALLHTDIELFELASPRLQKSLDGMAAMSDGRIAVHPRRRHWSFARRLIDAVERPTHDAHVRQWYIATTAHMQSLRLLGYARQNLESALKRFPDDPRLLLYAGVLHEVWASPVNQGVSLPPGAKPFYGSRLQELRKASVLYSRALTVNPELCEARIRLGRVLGALGLHKDAALQLMKIASPPAVPRNGYYLSLYLGCELEALSRIPEAREQYQRAATLYPTAHAPLLALSHLARVSNDAETAVGAVQRLLAKPVADLWNDDPLWSYDVAHVQDAAALLAEMHDLFGELSR